MDPRDPEQWFATALAFHQAGNLDQAEAIYRSLLVSHPRHFSALTNLGTLQIQRGEREEGIRLIGLSLEIRPDQPGALNNRGAILRELHRPAEALESIDRAIALRPNYPEAHNNRAAVLADMKRHDEALASCERAIALKPDSAGVWNNRGNVLKDLGQIDAAFASYDRAIAFKPDFSEAHKNRAATLGELKRHEEALASYDRALALKPDFEFVPGNRLNSRMHLCLWDGIEDEFHALLKAVDDGKAVSTPFSLLAVPSSPAQQKRCAEIFAGRHFPQAATRFRGPESYGHDKIRIGYFSSDYRNHPTAHLIAGVIERHDRARFEVYGFSYGPDTGDVMRGRLDRAFDHFVDIRTRTDQQALALARKYEIDIAIDLNGYTEYSRTGMFSSRPAPVQVNFLGYPGTLGAVFMDYIVADPVVIPEDQHRYFSEKIVSMPHSYVPSDATRAIAERAFTRRELGLPEAGFVFCCFNNNFKITPEVFDLWMRLLLRVEGSVLWLFESSATAAHNLRREAARRGVAPERLVFAGWMEVSEHLARHRLADLALDTFYCGAHTTAADALWAGLPVLTCPGPTFASRVAASLLTAVGLPELITASPADHEALALELATHPEKLARLKQTLAANRGTRPLFDTALYTRHLEQAYDAMWQRCRDGLAPAPIQVQA